MIAQLGCKWCILLWALPSVLWVGSQCSRSINFFIPWLFCVSVCCPNAALTQCWTESAVYSKVAINDISFLQNTAFLLLPTQQLQRSYVISFWNVPYISSERWTGKTHSPKGLSSHGTAAQGTVECPSLGALKRLWGSCGSYACGQGWMVTAGLAVPFDALRCFLLKDSLIPWNQAQDPSSITGVGCAVDLALTQDTARPLLFSDTGIYLQCNCLFSLVTASICTAVPYTGKTRAFQRFIVRTSQCKRLIPTPLHIARWTNNKSGVITTTGHVSLMLFCC